MTGEWVKVSDKLPADEKPVLCGKHGVFPFTASYFEDRWWINHKTCMTMDSVTHWMKLPDPPEAG